MYPTWTDILQELSAGSNLYTQKIPFCNDSDASMPAFKRQQESFKW